MIEIPNHTFESVIDPIKTEETIYHQIKDLSLKYQYVALPIAYSINSLGVERTQSLIDQINLSYHEKKIFVCQHIYVNRINFGNNLVFTPHTEFGDPYYFIPHYNPIYHTKGDKKPIGERGYEFSFVGDFNTHSDRSRLSHINSEKIIVFPTGNWFFSHPEDKQKQLLSRYKEILEDTKISICPRGTGPSTLRLFESMSTGSVPLIFNNLKVPDSIKSLILKTDIDTFLQDRNHHVEGLQEISDGIYDIYWEEFSNENLYKSILKVIQ